MGVIKRTQCGMCAVSCGLEMEVENNQIVSVRPDPDSPRSQNYCCRKGRAAKYHTTHTERLTHPLKRVGDEFVEISWEQANREIAEKANAIINRHGPRSFTVLGGGLAACHSPVVPLIGIMNGVGSQYQFNPIGIEFMGSWWSNGRIYGDQSRYQEPDEHNTDNLVLWGCNPYVTHQMSSARRVIREMSNDPNKRVITIDPRVTETARMSDIHIALRAGTDSLFLRALIALILERDWQDHAYIDKWCKDFDKAAAWFKGFDIEAALKVCRVPYAQVEAFAKILCTEDWGVHQDLGVFCG
ncbi:MAG: molybdopterin-dependent oxidoreductase, partial [Pseudomonadota bacterium]